MSVEKKIKLYLVENEIKQKTLSEATGIDNTKLNMSLNGHRNLTFDEFSLIIGFLGVQANKFIEPKQKQT